MSISQFPAASAGGATATDVAIQGILPVAQTTYEFVKTLPAGIYTIAFTPLTSNAQVTFVGSSSVLTSLTTANGVAKVSIASEATAVYVTLKAGAQANTIITISYALEEATIGNGTIDTITNTGTYNQTGLLAVLAIGGGEAGGKGGIGYGGGGKGGDSGGIGLDFVYTNTAQTVTIGAKGVAAVSNNTNITAPNQSSFGNLVVSTNTGFYPIGQGGAATNDFQVGIAGNPTASFFSFNPNQTGNFSTGGGGSGNGARSNAAAKDGGGSGIGTGGTAAAPGGYDVHTRNPTTPANAGTGRGSGGGGGTCTGNTFPDAVGRFGADGTDGVVYVVRGF